jgi:predicted TIM-barrel fold metal-dependent hydrolase
VTLYVGALPEGNGDALAPWRYDEGVKIDFHVHIFPTWVAEEMEDLCRREPAFSSMYRGRRAAIADHRQLLQAMDEVGIEASVALGFAWRDQGLCRRHNDYLLEAAAVSGGRIIPFCTVNMGAPGAAAELERCARGGARGVGELRPEDQGWRLNGPQGEELAWLARRWGLILTFHVSEPVGHGYPGKGGLALSSFFRFASAHPHVTLVASHLGGGLPFFAHMPEVRELCRRIYFDTAACPFLYSPSAYRQVVELVGAERLLFGSDFPLLSPARVMGHLAQATLEEGEMEAIVSKNAVGLLGYVDSRS